MTKLNLEQLGDRLCPALYVDLTDGVVSLYCDGLTDDGVADSHAHDVRIWLDAQHRFHVSEAGPPNEAYLYDPGFTSIQVTFGSGGGTVDVDPSVDVPVTVVGGSGGQPETAAVARAATKSEKTKPAVEKAATKPPAADTAADFADRHHKASRKGKR